MKILLVLFLFFILFYEKEMEKIDVEQLKKEVYNYKYLKASFHVELVQSIVYVYYLLIYVD